MQTLRLLALLLALTSLGCAAEPACVFCGEPTETSLTLEGTEWRVSRLLFQPATPLARGERPAAHGLDVDGFDAGDGVFEESSTCQETAPDLVSTLDPRIGGVDNSGQELIGAGQQLLGDGYEFQRALDATLDEGRLAIGLRFGEADLDGRIPVELFALEVDPSALDADRLPRVTGEGEVLARATLQLASGGASGALTLSGLPADEGAVRLLPLRELEVRAIGISAPDADGRARGELGGALSVEALTAAGVRATGMEGIEDTLRGIFTSFADLDPSASDPETCTRVSVGLGLELVRL